MKHNLIMGACNLSIAWLYQKVRVGRASSLINVAKAIQASDLVRAV